MKKLFPLAYLCMMLTVAGCAQRTGDGDNTTAPDAAGAIDGNTSSGTYACRGGVDSTGDYFECRVDRIQPANAGETPQWVGECGGEGIAGYWSGPHRTAQKNGDYFRIYLQGPAVRCAELTVSQCSDRSNSHCWMQFGKDTGTDQDPGDPYRWCNNTGCAMSFIRSPGSAPMPAGNS